MQAGDILNVLSHGEAQKVMSGGQGVWEQTQLERLGTASSSQVFSVYEWEGALWQ